MKSPLTLVKDIYDFMTSSKREVPKESTDEFAKQLAEMVANRLSSDDRVPRLSPSSFGTKCDRKLWYSINQNDKREPLEPWVRIKFLYGDIIELLVLYLAKLSGHKVEGMQDKMSVHGVEGSRDAVIDGLLVDVKSAGSRSFLKFKDHELKTNDPFGYMKQLGLYLEGSKDDPLVAYKKEAAFLAVDKDLGHIVLDKYKFEDHDWAKEITAKRGMIAEKNPPKRAYQDEPEGRSGNMKLPLNCAYCDFKKHCWSDANNGKGLRTFIYSSGPKFLTKVEKIPEVVEIK